LTLICLIFLILGLFIMKQRNNILIFASLFLLISLSQCVLAESFTLYSIYYPEANFVAQSVDSPSDIPLKSPQMAFLFSAVIPGAGEIYSKAKRGIIFTAAEVAFWSAYIITHRQADDNLDEYTKFVDNNIVFEKDSPATSTKNWTLEDYEHSTQSDNWHYVYTETNGKPVERVGKFYWKDLPEEFISQSGDVPVSKSNSPLRVQAFDKRNSANDKYKQAKIFIGLVVVNHVISAVDARIAAKLYNNRISKSEVKVSFHPTISSQGHPGMCLALNKRF
jgi:hypothetical protein